jgi:hypothetical protein
MINQLKMFQTFWFMETAARDGSEIHDETEEYIDIIFVSIPLNAIIVVFSPEC